MATWGQVKDFVRSLYPLQKEEEDFFNLVFDLGNNRTQLVNVFKSQSKKGDIWIQICSPVGIIKQDKINNALEDVSEAVCGGLIKINEKHFVRHCMPIDDLSKEEFILPLVYVTSMADDLEEKYVGGDEH